MKRFKYIFLALVVAVGSTAVFTSCEDADKFRFPELGNGGFVKFVFQPDFWEGIEVVNPEAEANERFSVPFYHIGADPAEASFVAITEDPTGNVASYELFVQGDFKGAPEDPIAYMSTTTFPFDVSFTAADMAALFNVPVETFQANDEFEFSSRITTTSGVVYNSFSSACICPVNVFFDENGNPLDEDGNPFDPGFWNGGLNDGVLLQAGDTNENFILPAVRYIVKFRAPSN